MNVAIIEYKENIYEALRAFPLEDSLYLSVSAEASYELSKKNIKFLTDENVLSPQEFKEIGNENFVIVEKWVQKLEKTLQSKHQIFQEIEFYPFKWNFYRLKILMDAVRIRRILIERLIEKEKPLLIGTPVGAGPEIINDYHLFFHRYDSLYGLIAQKVALQKGIEFETWRKVEPNAPRDRTLDKMKTSLKKLKWILRIVSGLVNLAHSKQKNILIGSLGYDIEPLRQALQDKYNFYYYKNPLEIRSLRLLNKLKPLVQNCELAELDIKGAFKTIKITGDSIIDEILGERIQSYAEKFIPILWKGLNYLESIDSQKNFKAFILAGGASNSSLGLPLDYFESKNKPVVVVQHGGYGFALNRITEYSEFGHNGYFLAWGIGINEMYEGHKKGTCKIIPTGSHLIEKINKNRKIRKFIKKVCYVPNLYRGYTGYYPNGQPCRDSMWFIMETNFLSALKPYQNKFQITYKIAPGAIKESPIFGRNPMLDWVKENLPEVRIESQPLQTVIHKFDLFIIDFPTTTLVQAMASGAEVLVYIGNFYHTPSGKALEMLKKRTIVGINEEDFIDKIKSVLDKGEIISDTEDTSFLEKYGVYLNDGKALERMVNQVLTLC
jgi:hypothetical protein